MSGFSGGGIDQSAWSTWVPTFTMSTVGGTPITATTSGSGARYKKIGKTMFFTLDATISDVGVGNSGQFIASLPLSMLSGSTIIVGSGKEVATLGKLLGIQAWSATEVSMVTYDNLSLITGGNGTRVLMGGTCETA